MTLQLVYHLLDVTPPLSSVSICLVVISTLDFRSVWWGLLFPVQALARGGNSACRETSVTRAFHKREQGHRQRGVGACIKTRAKAHVRPTSHIIYFHDG